MRNVFLLLLLIIYPIIIKSQISDRKLVKILETGSEKKLIKECTYSIRYGDYYSANKIVDKLLTINPGNANYNYRKGMLLLNVKNDYVEAIPYLKLAIFNISEKYDEFGPKERSAPYDAVYFLARCYHLNEDIDLAIEHYKKFIGVSKSKSKLFKNAEFYLVQCGIALKVKKTPVNSIIKNLGEKVNSQFSDYSPAITSDLSKLFFNSKRPWQSDSTVDARDFSINNYGEDSYIALNESDTSWSQASRLVFCTEKGNEVISSVETNLNKLFICTDSISSGDIYFTENNDYLDKKIELFSEIPNLNTKAFETGLTFSNDGNTAFFVSDRPGGFGGTDIYTITKANGSWSNPINMGSSINSKYDEDSPMLSFDGKTLYFTSNGLKSIGGYDVLFSILLENGTWSESINMGYPINSTNDDMFFTPFPIEHENKGYLSSNRKGGYGKMDIYEVTIDTNLIEQIALFENRNTNRSREFSMEDILSYMNYDQSQLKNIDSTDMFLVPLQTNSVTKITSNGATFSGKLISLKGEVIMERGFVYSTSPEPTIQSNKIVEGIGRIGDFSISTSLDLDNGNILLSNTKYYVRAFATSEHNVTSYGQEVTFTTLPVGQKGPSGGYVFYDRGVNSRGWRYLEAAPNDQTNGIEWGCDKISMDSTFIEVGKGESNTKFISTHCSKNNASKICSNLSLNGTNDWFLPSIVELYLMYINLHSQNLGNFVNDFYWSSSESSATEAISLGFEYGYSSNDSKSYTEYVRAARKF